MENDSPEIGESDVECHEDAECEGGESGTIDKESFAQTECKELAVPQCSGECAIHEIAEPDVSFAIVGAGVVACILDEAIGGIGE